MAAVTHARIRIGYVAHMATDRLKRMLEPGSLAVVAPPGAATGPLLEALAAEGYGGRRFIIGRSVPGFELVVALDDLPEPVDLVIAPVDSAAETIAAAGRRGCAGVLVVNGDRRDAPVLAEGARKAGVRLLGPDSMGLVAPRLHLNASFAPFVPGAGSLALVAQSNSIAAGILAWAARREVGFSGVVTLGAAADVDLADALDHFGQDGRTRAILLALDEVEDAARFLSSARAAARLKPVLVLKAWQPSIRNGGLTHAGLIVTSDRAHDAAFHRAGLLRVNDLDELFAAAETLGRSRQLVGGRLAIVSNGAGLAALAAGRLRQLGGASPCAAPTPPRPDKRLSSRSRRRRTTPRRSPPCSRMAASTRFWLSMRRIASPRRKPVRRRSSLLRRRPDAASSSWRPGSAVMRRWARASPQPGCPPLPPARKRWSASSICCAMPACRRS